MNLEELKTLAACCNFCELHEGRNMPVFAKGNPNAEIMICGMVPADEENKLGSPFVGKAGQLLDQILEDSFLTLDTVYITNLVKCYLPAGLPLKQHWIDSCLPYLITQIGIIKPKVIITLGKDSSCTLLGIDTKVSLAKMRKESPYLYGNETEIIPTYHPSYLLRAGGKNHKNYIDVVADFLLANKFLSGST